MLIGPFCLCRAGEIAADDPVTAELIDDFKGTTTRNNHNTWLSWKRGLDEEELRAKFDEIDSSGDGSLDKDELLEVFNNIGGGGPPVEIEVIDNLIHLADEDGNGTIEWDEFRTIFQVLKKMTAAEAAAKA